MSMILIFSEHQDRITDEVCTWLNYFDAKFIRINREDTHLSIKVEITAGADINVYLTVEQRTFTLREVNTAWFRRGIISPQKQDIAITCFSNKKNNERLRSKIIQYCFGEYTTLTEYVYEYLLKHSRCIGFPSRYNVNKLYTLDLAIACGLKVPDTLVTSFVSDLSDFIKQHESKVITKSIKDWNFDIIENHALALRTNIIPDLSDIPSSFYYSLFQEKIEKLYEVRSFIWDGKSYSAAIYSLPGDEANIDFRNSPNYENIRIVPYSLPKEIELRLLNLVDKLNIDSGSADFIVAENNEFYFLEINPVGQLDFLDKICSYSLPKRIAETLTNNESYR